MVANLFRCALFLAAGAGWAATLYKRLRVEMEFVPALYCSGCVAVLFLAGLWNLLPEAVAVLLLTGLILLLREGRGLVSLSRRSLGILALFCAAAGVSALFLYGFDLRSYDDFSHWGVVVDQMLRVDRMPNFTDLRVNFQSYPLGSSLWIYYVCRSVGMGENGYLLCQMLLLISLLLPVTALVNRNNWYLAPVVAGYVVYTLTAVTPMTALTVDTLLGAAAVAPVAMGIYYREQPRKGILCAAPVLVLLIQMKNSGIFFLGVYLVWTAMALRKTRIAGEKSVRDFLIWNFALPLASLVLWQKHVELVFAQGQTTKHAMFVENYAGVFRDKTLGDIQAIWSGLWQKCLSPEQGVFWLLLMLSLGLLVMALLRGGGKTEARAALGQLGALWLVYGAYVLGLFAMYLFSMPTHEALKLSSSNRYLGTCGIFLLGVSLVSALGREDSCRSVPKGAAALAGAVMTLACFVNPFVPGFRYDAAMQWQLSLDLKREQERIVLNKALEDYGNVIENTRQFVYYPDSTDDYLWFLLRYLLNTSQVSVTGINAEVPEDLTQLALEADYLLIWTPDAYSDALLAEAGYEELQGKQGAIVNLMGLRE